MLRRTGYDNKDRIMLRRSKGKKNERWRTRLLPPPPHTHILIYAHILFVNYLYGSTTFMCVDVRICLCIYENFSVIHMQ